MEEFSKTLLSFLSLSKGAKRILMFLLVPTRGGGVSFS
jgi:hypothetical protein